MALPRGWAVEESVGKRRDLLVTQTWPFWGRPGQSGGNKLGPGPGTSPSSLASPTRSPWRPRPPFSLPLGMDAVCVCVCGGTGGGAAEPASAVAGAASLPTPGDVGGRGRAGFRGSQVRLGPRRGQKASWAGELLGHGTLPITDRGARSSAGPTGNECPLV